MIGGTLAGVDFQFFGLGQNWLVSAQISLLPFSLLPGIDFAECLVVFGKLLTELSIDNSLSS